MVKPDGPTMQSRIGFVKDWDELAARTANRFAAECQCDKRAVFVAPGPSEMPFATAYRRLLEEKLLSRGVAVTENAVPASVVITFQVQPFLYDHTGRLMPAVWLPLGEVLDDLTSLYDVSRAEVMLTVSVSDGNFLRYRDDREFYIRPTDIDFYMIPPDDSHWVNNPAAGIRAKWPESWDAPTGHPALDQLVGPERQLESGVD